MTKKNITVKSYVRKNGTEVKTHKRKNPKSRRVITEKLWNSLTEDQRADLLFDLGLEVVEVETYCAYEFEYLEIFCPELIKK